MSNEDLPAFADLVQALAPGGYAIQARVDADGKWSLSVIDKDDRRLPAALGVAGYASLHRTVIGVVRQLDDAPLPGRVHRALDTWRRRHTPESAP